VGVTETADDTVIVVTFAIVGIDTSTNGRIADTAAVFAAEFFANYISAHAHLAKAVVVGKAVDFFDHPNTGYDVYALANGENALSTITNSVFTVIDFTDAAYATVIAADAIAFNDAARYVHTGALNALSTLALIIKVAGNICNAL